MTSNPTILLPTTAYAIHIMYATVLRARATLHAIVFVIHEVQIFLLVFFIVIGI
jgi:hypothetical protein